MPASRQQPGSGATSDDGGLVLCGATLADGRAVDVRLGGGRIQAVGTAGSLAPPADGAAGARVDLGGYLLLPAPAEPHAHGETAFTAATAEARGAAGSPSRATRAEVQRRTTEAVLLQLGHGATALRTHVRIGGAQGLDALDAVLAARAALRGLADLTAVAMPGRLTGGAGAGGRALLRDAVKMGATAVGGCPDLDPDPDGYAEAVLQAADEHGCAVDLHTDGADPDRLGRLAAMARGLRSAVAVGPCGGLARLPYDAAVRAAGQLAAAGVAAVCLPQGRCGALGPRHAGVRPARPAPFGLLRAAGVRVAAGSGALRDAANPVGRGDPLQAAYLLASLGEAAPEAAYEAAAGEARAVLGLPEVRVEAGFPAELLAVRGESIAGVLSLAYSRIVIHRGRVVARTSAVREYCDSAGAGAAELELPRQGPRG